MALNERAGSGSSKQLPAIFNAFSIVPNYDGAPTVIIETVKGAENGRGLIVRLYETARSRPTIDLIMGFAVAEAWETDLMEADETPLPISNEHLITLTFTPYQIRTLRLIPK